LHKPIVVHSRDAAEDTIAILRQNMPPDHPVHYHCFGDDGETAKTLLTSFPNLYIGLTGSITFENSRKVREVVRDIIPLERILLETDGPYLTPQGMHAHVNHPGSILFIAQTIADLKKVTIDEVLAKARENTQKCYSI